MCHTLCLGFGGIVVKKIREAPNPMGLRFRGRYKWIDYYNNTAWWVLYYRNNVLCSFPRSFLWPPQVVDIIFSFVLLCAICSYNQFLPNIRSLLFSSLYLSYVKNNKIKKTKMPMFPYPRCSPVLCQERNFLVYECFFVVMMCSITFGICLRLKWSNWIRETS